jgi:hypothetical protein
VVPPADADGEVETHAEADVAVETDAEAEADTGADADDGDAAADEADADVGTCVGGLYDPTTGLCWQDPVLEEGFTWNEALSYCAALDLEGHGPGSWHAPSISELRSLVRGCPETTTGGACGVTDACLEPACEDGWSCDGCPYGTGPGTSGMFWPSGLRGPEHWYWSSSLRSDDVAHQIWIVAFAHANLSSTFADNIGLVRCVRPGP